MKNIQCPHCGHEFSNNDMERADNDLWAICPDERDAEEVCPCCKETFFIKGGYEPTYEVFKTEEDMDEEA